MPQPPPRPELPVAAWPPDLPRPGAWGLLKGGWVATTWWVDLVDGRLAVAKVSPFPVAAELDGLAALAGAGVPVPEVLWAGGNLLVLARVAGPPDWLGLGAAVARMHQHQGPAFGWHQDNRMGRFAQPNTWSEDWREFFVTCRVRIHLAAPEIPQEFRYRLERACDGVLQALLPAHPTPVLTHGDLWAGNIVAGRCLIDPEVSFADRELDLVNMLGSASDPLPEPFWTGYRQVYPLPEDLSRRRPALALHHRLLGVRHFGGKGLPGLAADLAELGC